PPPPTQRRAGRPALAAPARPGYPWLAARLLARPRRLGLRPRPTGPGSLHQGPPPEPRPPRGECPVLRLGGPRPADPGRAGRHPLGDLGGRVDRPDLGRPGTDLPGPSRHLECQLVLPPVGPADLPQRRREPG